MVAAVISYKDFERKAIVERLRSGEELSVRLSPFQMASLQSIVNASQEKGLFANYPSLSAVFPSKKRSWAGGRLLFSMVRTLFLHHKIIELWGLIYQEHPVLETAYEGNSVILILRRQGVSG